ncbi:PH domain-containing protein [Nocardiopsis sp. NPDC055551]
MTSHDDHRPEEPVPNVARPETDPTPADAHAPEPNPPGQEVPAETGEPTGDWPGLSPLSVWANTVIVALFMVPSAIVATVVLVVVDQPLWALLPLPATGAFIALMTYLDMLRLRAVRYRVTADRMEMRSGIIAKAYRSIPRERVRSVDVAAPIYVRVFGLCTVTVGTGEKVGSGADQLKLEFVTAEQGERLRRELLRRSGADDASRAPAEGEDGSLDEDGVELARLNPRWFAYAPATTATFGIGLGVIAALIGANAQSGGHGWEWISEQAGLPGSQQMADFVMSRLLLVVPLFLVGLLLSGVVILLLAALETWWNYRLTREPDGTVRLRRGLLTSVSLSVEGRRLNGVVLHEPFVLRSVRGASIQAVATGLESGDDKKTSAKSRLSPAMPRSRARALGAALMRQERSPLDVPLATHPRAALRRRFTRATFVTLMGVALAGGLAWLHMVATESWWEMARTIEENIVPIPLVVEGVEATPGWGWFALAIVLGVLAFWYAVGSYRGLGHGLHPKYLVLRKGMAVRDTVTLERSAVIGWRITRSPFQRRLGLADVAATTAAGDGMYAALDVGLGQGLAWADEAVPELLAPFLERPETTGEAEGSRPTVLP